MIEKKENVLTVPNNAVQREEGQKYVYVSQNDKIIKKQVKVGWKDKRYTEILEGLIEGEKAVIGDLDLLTKLITNQIIRRQNDTTQ